MKNNEKWHSINIYLNYINIKHICIRVWLTWELLSSWTYSSANRFPRRAPNGKFGQALVCSLGSKLFNTLSSSFTSKSSLLVALLFDTFGEVSVRGSSAGRGASGGGVSAFSAAVWKQKSGKMLATIQNQTTTRNTDNITN